MLTTEALDKKTHGKLGFPRVGLLVNSIIDQTEPVRQGRRVHRDDDAL